MKLLIIKTEYDLQTSLPGITNNNELVMINNISCVYADLVNEQQFMGLNIENCKYAKGDGILLPKEAL